MFLYMVAGARSGSRRSRWGAFFIRCQSLHRSQQNLAHIFDVSGSAPSVESTVCTGNRTTIVVVFSSTCAAPTHILVVGSWVNAFPRRSDPAAWMDGFPGLAFFPVTMRELTWKSSRKDLERISIPRTCSVCLYDLLVVAVT